MYLKYKFNFGTGPGVVAQSCMTEPTYTGENDFIHKSACIPMIRILCNNMGEQITSKSWEKETVGYFKNV